MNRELLLGIDLGTTLIKVGVFTTTGGVIQLRSAPTPITWDGPQEAHHDPDALWAVVADLIQEAALEIAPTDLACLGISSFGEAGVLLDDDGQPRSSILAWFDTRAKPDSDELFAHFDVRALRERTGLMADHTYSLSKLLWLKNQRPLEGLRWVSTADWIAFKLTGRVQMGLTQASRTLLFDLEKRTWMDDVLRDLGLPSDLLAPLRPPGEAIGQVTSEAAARTGLPCGLPVMESAHDQPCAAAGAGATEPGVLLNACGTAEIMFATLEARQLQAAIRAQSVAVGHHALPGRYWVMASMRASGSVFDWFVRMFNDPSLDAPEFGKRSVEAYQRVTKAAARAPVGADGVCFVPHLRQLSDDPREPSLDGGVFTGLREAHGLGHLARAVLEGLSFESAHLLERIRDAIGRPQPGTSIRAVGGPTQNALWMQIKADLYGTPIQVYSAPNATVWGAAWLGWYHLNASQGAPITTSAAMPALRVYQPNLEAERAGELRARYRARVQQLMRAKEETPPSASSGSLD